MAKSINEYYDLIVRVKEGSSELQGLTPLNDGSHKYLNDNASGSRIAIWRMWAYIMAVIAWLLDTMFDKHKTEVDAIAQSLHYGTLRWYHRIALEFQYGDTIIWNGFKYTYSQPDPQKQIIKRVAVMANDGVLQFKVATLNAAGRPEKLKLAQINAFAGYINDMAYPGTNYTIISQNPDQLRIGLRVYYDALVFNPDGSLIADDSVFPVKDAVAGFISNLPFNGRMNIQSLTDAIQAVDGVQDIVLDVVQARYGVLPWATVQREYVPFAGHMVLDEQTSSIQYFVYE